MCSQWPLANAKWLKWYNLCATIKKGIFFSISKHHKYSIAMTIALKTLTNFNCHATTFTFSEILYSHLFFFPSFWLSEWPLFSETIDHKSSASFSKQHSTWRNEWKLTFRAHSEMTYSPVKCGIYVMIASLEYANLLTFPVLLLEIMQFQNIKKQIYMYIILLAI